MEENNKSQELAFKMADVFKGYTVGEVLEALEVTTIIVINSENNNPLGQIMAYSQIINSLSKALTKISKDEFIKTLNTL